MRLGRYGRTYHGLVSALGSPAVPKPAGRDQPRTRARACDDAQAAGRGRAASEACGMPGFRLASSRNQPSCRRPPHVDGGRLAEHQAARRRRAPGSSRTSGSSSSCRSATSASMRARCMPRQTCGPWAKAAWWRAFSRRTSKRSGSGKKAGSRFAADSETTTSRPRRSAPRRAPRRGSRSGRRGWRRAPAAATPRRRWRAGTGRPHGGQRLGVAEHVPDEVGDHALGRLDAAEQQHRGVGDHAGVVQPVRVGGREHRVAGAAPSRLPRTLRSRSANASRPAAVTAGRRRRRRPRRRCARTSRAPSRRPPSPAPARAPSPPRRAGRRAPGAPPPPRPARRPRAAGVSSSTKAEALAHRVEPERPRERVAMARVLGAVQRQHARADDLRGREARGRRCRLRVAHDVQHEVAARHQPAPSAGTQETGSDAPAAPAAGAGRSRAPPASRPRRAGRPPRDAVDVRHAGSVARAA